MSEKKEVTNYKEVINYKDNNPGEKIMVPGPKIEIELKLISLVIQLMNDLAESDKKISNEEESVINKVLAKLINEVENFKEAKEPTNIYIYHEGETKARSLKGALWERNILIQYLAWHFNQIEPFIISGWYKDKNFPEGFQRCLSLLDGKYCFIIPDELPIGKNIPEIEPNWDGHTTAEKWENIKRIVGIENNE
ncbi:MAG: hypothetical protein ACFFDH_00620 [Promethearchaeota archaeon]